MLFPFCYAAHPDCLSMVKYRRKHRYPKHGIWQVQQEKNQLIQPGSIMVQLKRPKRHVPPLQRLTACQTSRYRTRPVMPQESTPLLNRAPTDSGRPAVSRLHRLPSALLYACFSLTLRSDRSEALISNHSSTSGD